MNATPYPSESEDMLGLEHEEEHQQRHLRYSVPLRLDTQVQKNSVVSESTVRNYIKAQDQDR